MAGRYDVYVFEDDHTTYVRPATVAGIAGRALKFRNLTDTELAPSFPEGLMTKYPADPIPARGHKSYTVQGSANGLYTYRVPFQRAGKKRKAVGESEPRIIIDL